MKRLYVFVVAVFLSIFLVVAANATQPGNKDITKGKKTNTQVSSPEMTATPKGLTNLQKVMMQKIERSKAMHQKIEGPSEN